MSVPEYQVNLVSSDGATTYDVSQYVRSVSIDRGRSRELDRFEAGTFSVAFDNRLRYFDPQYTDSTTRTNLVKNPIPSTSAPVSPQETWQMLNRGTGGAGTTVLTANGAVDTVTTAASTVVYSFGITGGTTAARIQVTAGLTYAFSMYVTSSVNDVRRLAATFYDAGGTSLGDVVVGVGQTLTAGVETRLVGTYTAPAGAVSVRMYGGNTTGSIIRPLNSTMTWRYAMVEQASTVGTYFSGNTTDTNYQIYSWSGTAQASTSTLVQYANPYYGLIIPNLGVQILSEGYGRIWGFIKDWNLSYDISGDSLAISTGADAFSFLAQQQLSSALSPAQQTAGNRIGYVLSQPEVAWPYGGPEWTLDTTNTREVQSHTIDAGTNILEYAQLVERTENGFFFLNSGGMIEFQADGYELLTDVVFTDDGSDIPYQGINIVYGTELLYNQVTLERLGGTAVVTATNDASIAAYGNSAYSDSGLLYVDDAQMINAADMLAAKYGEPEYRFESVTVFLNALSDTDLNRILSLDICSVVQVSFTPNQVGAAITKYARVIGMSEEMLPDSYTITFKLATLDNEAFTLGSDVSGLLDYNLLGY
jgi:hypothetical protein